MMLGTLRWPLPRKLIGRNGITTGTTLAGQSFGNEIRRKVLMKSLGLRLAREKKQKPSCQFVVIDFALAVGARFGHEKRYKKRFRTIK